MENERFSAAIALFDEANAKDPNSEVVDGGAQPKELVYGRRMSACLDKFLPDASEALRLAVRCQHIRRWEIPRDTYPRDRTGYLRWRTQLRKFHAEAAGEILRSVGYDEPLIGEVQSVLRKENLKTNAETQALEDVICLVFLEFYFDAFAAEHSHEPDKVVDIVRKTWGKMSDAGHEAALQLPFSDSAKALIGQALGG
jgi:hypothetical protein